MLTFGMCEAERRFAELLDKAANGAIVTITRHGTPAAVLIPGSSSKQAFAPP